MFRRRALVLAVALFGLTTARASADVTVLYAPPGPPAPLVASVVPRSEVVLEPAPSEPAPTASVPSEPRSAPAPIDPRSAPAPTDSRSRDETRSTVEPAPTPSARPMSGERRVRMIRRDGDEREEVEIALVDAEGQPDPAALEALSILARPAGTARPSEEALASHRDDLGWLTSDLRRLHPALLLRLEQIRRAYPGHAIEIVSGLRTDGAESSRHRSARALDLRVVGVSSASLDALARTLPETGVGLCSASDLVHVDIRARSAHWIDLHP